MTENQRKALQLAEETFRRYSDHHAMKGDETKARANMALAGQMSAALAESAPVPMLTTDEKLQIAMSCNMRIRTCSGAVKYATAVEQAVRQKAGLA